MNYIFIVHFFIVILRAFSQKIGKSKKSIIEIIIKLKSRKSINYVRKS